MTFSGNDKGSEAERRKEALRVLNLEWGSKLEAGSFEIDWKNNNGAVVHEFIPDFASVKSYLLRMVDRGF